MAQPAIVLVHGFWGDAAHWSKVIIQLSKLGYELIFAVENPLSSLFDDAERTRKMIAQQKGPVLLVGHSYGGAVITQAGDQPNVVGLVYIAAFAPDVGESVVDLGAAFPPPPGVANAAPDSDGYVWIKPKAFRESFCQDLSADEALVMATTSEGAGWKRLWRKGHGRGLEDEALLLSDFQRGSDDRTREREEDGGADRRQKDHHARS